MKPMMPREAAIEFLGVLQENLKMTDYAEVNIDGVRHVSDSAVLVTVADNDSRWVPLSVLSEDSRSDLTNEGWQRAKSIEIEVWFAEKEGFV